MNTSQLRTQIEKTFHRLIVDQIKEHVVDFTILYINKNKIPVDRDSLTKILEVIRLALDDGYYKHVDGCLNTLEPKLQEFVDDANPLQATSASATAKNA